MPKMNPAVREAAIADIAKHFLEHGPGGWEYLIAKYPQVTTRTFFRWVEGVKAGRLAPDEMKAEGRRRAAAAMSADLPALPNPQYMATGGRQAQEDMDFLSMIKLCHGDLMLTRLHALTPEGDKVKNPGLMIDNVLARLRTCETGLRIIERAWDVQHIARFCKAILDAILEEVSSPIERQAIADRLHDLNQEYNMTMAAGRPPL